MARAECWSNRVVVERVDDGWNVDIASSDENDAVLVTMAKWTTCAEARAHARQIRAALNVRRVALPTKPGAR